MAAEEFFKAKGIDGATTHRVSTSEITYLVTIEIMEEYGKQCYIQGSNDCHKSLYNAYNESIETIKNKLQP